MRVELHQIVTADGIPLEGLLFKPKRKGTIMAFWLGGITSRFSNNPERIHALARILGQKGITFAVFDHRGLGIVNAVRLRRSRTKKRLLVGTGFEKFEHSVLDIEAMLRFGRTQGCRQVFLLGHSTGANKAAYYLWKKGGRGLRGIALLGPVSDIPAWKRKLGRNYRKTLRLAGRMVARGNGKTLLPPTLIEDSFWSAERFWSIAREGSNEDMFPYYDPERRFRWTRRVRRPVLILIGGKDQHADRPVHKILDAFQRQIPPRWFTGVIVAGADHSFVGKEAALARNIRNWILRVQGRRI